MIMVLSQRQPSLKFHLSCCCCWLSVSFIRSLTFSPKRQNSGASVLNLESFIVLHSLLVRLSSSFLMISQENESGLSCTDVDLF